MAAKIYRLAATAPHNNDRTLDTNRSKKIKKWKIDEIAIDYRQIKKSQSKNCRFHDKKNLLERKHFAQHYIRNGRYAHGNAELHNHKHH